MIALANINELEALHAALSKLGREHPSLFENLLDCVKLTRALQFKYQYMGCLLMDENEEPYQPSFVYRSVLNLYKIEIQKVKENSDYPALQQLFANFSNIGYAKISQLLLGKEPVSLVGPSVIS